jgi:hypothetical protein
MLTFNLGRWPEKSGLFFDYQRIYWLGIWTPFTRAQRRYYGAWEI